MFRSIDRRRRPCGRGGDQMAILVSLFYGGGGEVWEPEGNGYTRLTTTLWSLSMCRGVSLSGIQHRACEGWSDGYTRLLTLWWGW